MLARLRHPLRPRPNRVTVLRLQGVISGTAGRGALNHAALAPLLERAFRKGKPNAVALSINSPGGSPVQSSLIGAHIRRLSEELSVPVHAFVEDVAASGGYWIAAAADDIWVDESSITGSIGVISASFGFQELIARYGVERRVHTAGEDKSMLDPFRAERAEDVERLKDLQAKIHVQFIDHVKARRGTRLVTDRDLFTGEIFLGRDAIDTGLADGVAHLVPKLQELYGEKVKLTHLGQKRPLLQRLVPGLLASAEQALVERVAWARFGL
ncbi:S49 family peptidase [Jannaschia marina]|uniref:S49 family peptidase n=1 Tax=Jannaschia marina TaxID=2741674 RepID=UPI0015CC173C|nr:S49 family peptidase [Jannaschia marina]